VGAYLPLRISTTITIFSLAHELNKTNLMEQIFLEWIDRNYTQEVEMDCFQKIAEAMHGRYEELRQGIRSLTYSMFCEDLKKELLLKGLNYTHIQAIQKEFDRIHFQR
jgi:hypothetical protein